MPRILPSRRTVWESEFSETVLNVRSLAPSPNPKPKKVGNAEAFGLLLQVGARIGSYFLKGGVHRNGNANRGFPGQNRIELQSIPEAEDHQDDSYERHQTQKKSKVIHILHRPLAAELESLVPETALEPMINGIPFLKSFPFDLPWSA